ncbi:MAG: hypothetical protein ABI167_02390 [Nitrosospira sp.]
METILTGCKQLNTTAWGYSPLDTLIDGQFLQLDVVRLLPRL